MSVINLVPDWFKYSKQSYKINFLNKTISNKLKMINIITNMYTVACK